MWPLSEWLHYRTLLRVIKSKIFIDLLRKPTSFWYFYIWFLIYECKIKNLMIRLLRKIQINYVRFIDNLKNWDIIIWTSDFSFRSDSVAFKGDSRFLQIWRKIARSLQNISMLQKKLYPDLFKIWKWPIERWTDSSKNL